MLRPITVCQTLTRSEQRPVISAERVGAPKGDAVSRGWKFKREFEHSKVAVDLEKREGRIQWLEK